MFKQEGQSSEGLVGVREGEGEKRCEQRSSLQRFRLWLAIIALMVRPMEAL